ncbi:hypothetical protein [Pseudofrankia sp. DC12]|uniref:PH-like domain-containing protein n=1 Tax=Pseudofrankia sp. DC12 TaxID=683315 RepID=UPI000696F60F|nr:hypothetical protein [Pseudofrankia sp. DC12]
MNLSAGHVLAMGGGSGLLGVRLLLFFGVLLLIVAVIGFLRQAWRRRATRDEEDLPELLAPPEDPGTVLAAPLRGAYLGTADAGHWLEWFSASGLGGKEGSYISVYESGVRVDRAGRSFWIPRDAVRGARFERAHVGKVAAPGRLLVIAWSLEGRELETGFRGEDRVRQPKVMRSVHDLIGPPSAPSDGEITSPRPAVRSLRQLRPRRHHPAGAGVGPAAGPGADGAGAAPVSRGRGGHLAHAGRSIRPRRRERPRSLDQEIADRRGDDPYGTGPRTPARPGVDPYVTNPRNVPFGTGIGRPGPVSPPPAAPAGQPPSGRPRVAGPPSAPGRAPVTGQHPRAAQYPPATGPRGGAAPTGGYPAPGPRGGGQYPADQFPAAQPTSPRAYPAPVAPPAPPSAYGTGEPGGGYPSGQYTERQPAPGYPGAGQYPAAGQPGPAADRPQDPYAGGQYPPAGWRDPYAARPGASAPAQDRYPPAPGGQHPWEPEAYSQRDPYADPYAAAGPGGAPQAEPYADPYGQYDAGRRRPRPEE